ncbi:MAG: YchJ family protein [Chromatiaceae bacterium]
MKPDTPCPCGTGKLLSVCCGPFVEGAAQAQTAEQLMRSRYTAYVVGRADYLTATWHPTTRRRDVGLDPAVTWIDLKILRTKGGSTADKEGVVEFVARYKIGGRAHRLHEASRFVRRDGQWLYVHGELDPSST